MAVSKSDLLAHFKYLQRAIDGIGAEAILSFANFSVLIRCGKKNRVLYPQFLTLSNNVKQYSQIFSSDAKQFIGWLPYYNKRWDLASSKLAFKHFASTNGLRTPEISLISNDLMNDVLVKRDASSFGGQIQGPFRASSEMALDSARDEYYERFVLGKIVKAWYWDGTPVCMELDTMPYLIGDGTSTIAELLQRRLNANKKKGTQVFGRVSQTLAYFGLSLDSVLERKQKQLVEFRYGSDITLPVYRQIIDLRKGGSEGVKEQLLKIGKTLWSKIQTSVTGGTLFAVDAILDSEDRIWVLEMNSNPHVHPLVYLLMVPALYADSETPVESAVLQ